MFSSLLENNYQSAVIYLALWLRWIPAFATSNKARRRYCLSNRIKIKIKREPGNKGGNGGSFRERRGRGFTPHVVIHYGRGCQWRQWTDVKGLRGAWRSDAAGGGRKMILLIQLSGVIGLHGTRARSSTITIFYVLCEFLCAALSCFFFSYIFELGKNAQLCVCFDGLDV